MVSHTRAVHILIAGIFFTAADCISAGSNVHESICPPFNKDNFTVSQYQLYPENAIWDTEHCVVYFWFVVRSSLLNIPDVP